MNLQEAIAAHVNWLVRLGDLLADPSHRVDVGLIRRTDRCCVGLWLTENEAAFRHIPEFRDVWTIHAQFHECAAVAAEKYNAGDDGAALEILDGATTCGGLSDALIQAFADLDRELRLIGEASAYDSICEGPGALY